MVALNETSGSLDLQEDHGEAGARHAKGNHHDDDEHEGHGEEGEPWLMSFADLILNLLLFFIVLYSISDVSEQKILEMAQAINGVNTPQASVGLDDDEDGKAKILQEVQALMQKLNDNISSDEVKKEAEKVKDELGKMFRVAPGKDKSNDLFELILAGEKYFSPGSSKLSKQGVQAIKTLSKRVSKIKGKIGLYIEGHTDPSELSENSPEGYEWSLASERAAQALMAIQATGLKVSNVSTAGFGARLDFSSEQRPEVSTKPEEPKGKLEATTFSRARVHLRVVRHVREP